jgi:hypothetical protein
MDETGGCYCGALRYHVTVDPIFKAQCLCRECQYISGGGPNFFMIVPDGGFRYTLGTAQEFTRTDLETPVTRQLCGICDPYCDAQDRAGNRDPQGRHIGQSVGLWRAENGDIHR